MKEFLTRTEASLDGVQKKNKFEWNAGSLGSLNTKPVLYTPKLSSFLNTKFLSSNALVFWGKKSNK